MVNFTPIHSTRNKLVLHDDVNKCQHFPRYWPFVRGIHPSPVVPLTKASYAQLWCVFFYLRLNKRLSKQTRRRWFGTSPRSLWRHCNVPNQQFISGTYQARKQKSYLSKSYCGQISLFTKIRHDAKLRANIFRSQWMMCMLSEGNRCLPLLYGGPLHYRKTSSISRTLVGSKIVDNSDVVGASPVGAAPTTSSFST